MKDILQYDKREIFKVGRLRGDGLQGMLEMSLGDVVCPTWMESLHQRELAV